MVTIADIAKMAGVAKSTVSRYLNGGSVSHDTKKKIEKIIEKTEYVPNSFAQSLKARVTNFIGVVVPRLDSYSASRTMIGIDDQLRELNFKMLVANSSLSVEREIENIYSLAKQKVAGIILLATEITDAHLEAFNKIDIPILVVGQEHKDVHCLIYNDEEAAYELGKYVISNGHERIAFLGVTEKDISVGLKRKAGFEKAIREGGHGSIQFFETSFNSDDAREMASKIIADLKATIIVCATDNIALGVMKAAHEYKLRIPEDLSITGFGGYSVSEYTHPPLTTVKYHYKTGGKIAAQKLNDLINQNEIDRCTILDFEILKRESVDKL